MQGKRFLGLTAAYEEYMLSIMNNEFTSKEVEQILGIPFGRVKEWIQSGHITPSVDEGKGRGKVRKFSRDDLYRIALFFALRKIGIERDMAGLYFRHLDKRGFEGEIKVNHRFLNLQIGDDWMLMNGWSPEQAEHGEGLFFQASISLPEVKRWVDGRLREAE
jgi:hypothetical protein